MTRMVLPGLIGSHPLAALASFGLLRLVSEWDGSAKLGFTLEDDWVACLETARFDTLESLIARLGEWVRSDALDRAFGWADDVRVTPGVFCDLLRKALGETDTAASDWLSSLAAYGAVDRQKGLVKPCDFYMVSGQQSFLGGAREILAQVRAAPDLLFDEALRGPWRYLTRLHSLGWDPHTERLHALRSRSPSAEKPACIAAAVLLALCALPLYPALSSKGRARTIGFHRDNGETHFSWPVFSAPIGLFDLQSLIQAEAWRGVDGRPRSGVVSVYCSRRSEFGQGYAVFRAAHSERLSGHRADRSDAVVDGGAR